MKKNNLKYNRIWCHELSAVSSVIMGSVSGHLLSSSIISRLIEAELRESSDEEFTSFMWWFMGGNCEKKNRSTIYFKTYYKTKCEWNAISTLTGIPLNKGFENDWLQFVFSWSVSPGFALLHVLDIVAFLTLKMIQEVGLRTCHRGNLLQEKISPPSVHTAEDSEWDSNDDNRDETQQSSDPGIAGFIWFYSTCAVLTPDRTYQTSRTAAIFIIINSLSFSSQVYGN